MHLENKKENEILLNNPKIISDKIKILKKFFKFLFFSFILIFCFIIFFAFVYLFIQDRNLKNLKKSSILNVLTLEDRKNQTKDTINTLDEDIEKIKESFEEYKLKNQMQTKYLNTKTEITKIEEEIINTEEKITKIEEEITKTEGKITIIEGSIRNTQNKIQKIKQNIKSIDDEQKEYLEIQRNDNSNIQRNILDLNTKIKNLKSQKETEQTNLNTEQTNLNTEKIKLKNSQEILKKLNITKQNLQVNLKNLKDELEIQSKYLAFFDNMKQYLQENNFNINQYNKEIYNISIALSDSNQLDSNHVVDINDLYSKLLEKEFLNIKNYLIDLYENSKKLKIQQEQKLNSQNLEYEVSETKRYEIKNFIARIDMILNSLEYHFEFYCDSIQKILNQRHELHLFINRKNNFFDNVKYHFNFFCQLIKKRDSFTLENIKSFIEDIYSIKKQQVEKFMSFHDIQQIKDSLEEISKIKIEPKDFQLNATEEELQKQKENDNKQNREQVEKIDKYFISKMFNKEEK